MQPSSSQLARLLASLVEADPGAKELSGGRGAPETAGVLLGGQQLATGRNTAASRPTKPCISS